MQRENKKLQKGALQKKKKILILFSEQRGKEKKSIKGTYNWGLNIVSAAAPFYSTMGLMCSWPLACAVLRKGKNPSDSFLVKFGHSVPVRILFK